MRKGVNLVCEIEVDGLVPSKRDRSLKRSVMPFYVLEGLVVTLEVLCQTSTTKQVTPCQVHFSSRNNTRLEST